ncbi:MAG TPA: hypothetical protein VEF76_05105 [Patescibacteria group bacterium]|nr:hypothetical protein [Patescibacteria group bacterium]
MQKLIALLLLACLSSSAFAAAEDYSIVPDKQLTLDPAARAQFTVNMFFAGCFRNFAHPRQIDDWAAHFMRPVASDKNAKFLKSVNASSGKVWYASIAGGQRPASKTRIEGGDFALIHENGRCHIIGFGTDEKAFHAAVKKFAEDARKNMVGRKVAYSYRVADKADRKTPHNLSTVVISHRAGLVLNVAASSAPGGLNDETAIITLFSNMSEIPAMPMPPKGVDPEIEKKSHERDGK